jgi:hypothetical protein
MFEDNKVKGRQHSDQKKTLHRKLKIEKQETGVNSFALEG